MKKVNSWPVFLLGIRCLIIMTAPKAPDPPVMILGGLMVVLIAVMLIIRSGKNRHDSED